MERFDKRKHDEFFRRLDQCRSRRRPDGRGYRPPDFDPERLVETRERLQLSQSQFARMLHVSVDTLQNWEQGRRKPQGPAEALIYLVQNNPMAAFRALRVTLSRLVAESFRPRRAPGSPRRTPSDQPFETTRRDDAVGRRHCRARGMAGRSDGEPSVADGGK